MIVSGAGGCLASVDTGLCIPLPELVRLKVICGSNTSYLADSDWIGDNTPLTLCDVSATTVPFFP